MSEQSSNLIKHLLSMGVKATINHAIDGDIAEYLVKEFGHHPIKEEKAEDIIKKIKEPKKEKFKISATYSHCNGACRSRKNIFVRCFKRG